MTKLGIASAIACGVVAISCATTAKYEKILRSWVGKDVSELVEAWGPPDGTFTLPDGRIMYTWVADRGAVAVPIGNMAVAIPQGCKTTFTASVSGTIERWRHEGNACKAK